MDKQKITIKKGGLKLGGSYFLIINLLQVTFNIQIINEEYFDYYYY